MLAVMKFSHVSTTSTPWWVGLVLSGQESNPSKMSVNFSEPPKEPGGFERNQREQTYLIVELCSLPALGE